MTRCRCVSISASKACSNSSLPGLSFAPSCSWILRGHLVHAELDDRDVRRGRLEVRRAARCATARAAPAPAASKPRRKQMTIRSALCPSICTNAVAPASGTASARNRLVGQSLHDRPRRRRAQPIPPHAVHQVQQAPAFERLGNERVVHRRCLLGRSGLSAAQAGLARGVRSRLRIGARRSAAPDQLARPASRASRPGSRRRSE